MCSSDLLREWSIELSQPRYARGAVTLDITNEGEFSHTLVVEDATGRVLAATDVIAPGSEATVEVGLDGSQYRFTCRIVVSREDGTVVDHFQQGMTVTVTAAG